MGERLVPADARHLQGLRSMLEDARGLALRASPLQRTTATVLLDGVAERAVHLVAVSRGVKIPPKADFNALVQAVVESLGDSWVPSHLPDVRQLHRARNAAQHEGLPPDRDMLAPWADAVGAFVRGLVDAQFDVDLDRVALWHAVDDAGLRGHLQAADEALAAGDAVGSLTHSRAALGEAERLWQRLRERPASLLVPTFGPALGMASGNQLDEGLIALEREARLATFASNVSEVGWFTRLTRERPEVLDLDDAERGYAFAVTWVLGFEAARAGWTPGRRARADRAARLVRTGDAPAVIDSVADVAVTERESFVRVRLRGVPAENYEDWARVLNERLRAAVEPGGSRWQVDADGTARVSLRDLDGVENRVSVLAVALAEADELLRQARQGAADEKLAIAQMARELESALAELRPLPEWVRSVRLGSGESRGSGIALILSDDVARAGTNRVAGILRNAPGLAGASGPDEGTYLVKSAIAPAALIDALWAVDSQVRQVLRADAEAEADGEATRANLRVRVEAAIRSVSR